MTTVGLIVCGILLFLVLVGLVILVIGAARAPRGYEDEDGFHAGPETTSHS